MDNAAITAVIASSPSFLDNVKTWISYIGILSVSIVVAYGGIRKALKDLGDKGGTVRSPTAAQVVGGTIMETTTLLMWSESNRDVVEAMKAMTAEIRAICEKMDSLDNLSREVGELRHMIERVRDKM